MEKNKIIISFLATLLTWQITTKWIIEISFLNFIFIEIIIATGEFFGKLAYSKIVESHSQEESEISD